MVHSRKSWIIWLTEVNYQLRWALTIEDGTADTQSYLRRQQCECSADTPWDSPVRRQTHVFDPWSVQLLRRIGDIILCKKCPKTPLDMYLYNGLVSRSMLYNVLLYFMLKKKHLHVVRIAWVVRTNFELNFEENCQNRYHCEGVADHGQFYENLCLSGRRHCLHHWDSTFRDLWWFCRSYLNILHIQ